MSKKDRIHVVFGVDQNYVPHAAVVVASMLANAPTRSFGIHIVQTGAVSEAVRQQFEARFGACEIHWYQFATDSLDTVDLKLAPHVGVATFARLKVPELLAADRVIYLDADLVVTGDIGGLWDADLAGRSLGAVVDAGVDPVAFAARHGLEAGQNPIYCNTGVMLLDLVQLRQNQLFEKAMAIVLTQSQDLEHADQCALNMAFWLNWTPLDPIWNVQRPMALGTRAEIPLPADLRAYSRRWPGIIHYTTNRKPWLRTAYHPYAGAYWDYLAKTPFGNEVAAKSGVSLLRRTAWRARWWANAARLKLAA
jgi:lipopolysaccharide biosynthesis glycosyltransferase